jgi:UDP-N-acetylmuramyl pentapeptide phosphotransferase/UDP-N-acetylglucosamine-1-phosphate transferase
VLIEMGAALAVAGIAAAAIMPLVIRAGVMDMPDGARRNHHAPTPKAGGLAAAFGTFLAVGIVTTWPNAAWSAALDPAALLRMMQIAAFALAILALGLVDDTRQMGPRLKFGIMAALGLLLSATVVRAESIPLAGTLALELGFVFGVLGSALWAFTIINATNFVDGSNGLALGSLGVGLVGLAVLGVIHHAPHAAVLAAAGAGGLFGALFWNFPKARVFSGDTGSLYAGALAAGVGLALVQDGGVSPIIPPLVFFPILADVLLTLAFRVKRRRNILEGHREHLYQIAQRMGASHQQTAYAYWGMTALCAVLACLASLGPVLAPPAAFAPQPGDIAPHQVILMQSAAWVVSAAPLAALIIFAAMALGISKRMRAKAEKAGVDTAY